MAIREYILEIDDADWDPLDSTQIPYDLRGGVYFLQTLNFIKIGLARCVKTRLMNIRHASPFEVVPIAYIHCETVQAARELEGALHAEFAQHRERGEWFRDCDEIRAYIAGRAQPWPTKGTP